MAITSRALAFASRWFDPATVSRVFEPLIADWQREWQNAPRSRRAWISVRGAAAFACAFALLSPRVIVTPTPRPIASKVLRRITLFCLLIGGALSIPSLRSIDASWMETSRLLTLLLVGLPIGIVMAFPFAMINAVDAIRRDGGPAHVQRAAAVKLCIGAMVFMLIMQGVVLPSAHQQWLALSTPADWNVPAPTIGQSTTWELLTHPDREGALVPGHYSRAGEIRRQLIVRMVHVILPVMFIWLRWTSLSQRRRFWPPPAAVMTVLAAAIFFTTFALGFVLERQLLLTPGTGMWLPIAAALLFGIVQEHAQSRRTPAG